MDSNGASTTDDVLMLWMETTDMNIFGEENLDGHNLWKI
jgi:hypothetical protein